MSVAGKEIMELYKIIWKNVFCSFLLFMILLGFSPAVRAETEPNHYQWNISLNREMKGKRVKKVKKGSLLVIDAQNYSSTDIRRLHLAGYTVYSYLNIGSVEDNRSYYQKFKKYKLKTYENWEDEYWINVSRKKWQNFVQNKLAKNMVNKGIDGFWVDNCDVFEYNKKRPIFNGLVKILKNLNHYQKPIIINGGDQFVTPLIKRGQAGLIDGVVQEEVNTRISSYSGNGSFTKQRKSFKKYYENYFKLLKKHHLSVGVLEYTQNGNMKNTIKRYCKKFQLNYCIKSTIIV